MMNRTIWCDNGFPKVGIRPIIDGRRRGVRESLETQTMNMAKSAAKLISESLTYPDGSPVQCVIADTTIGGCAEAAACANKFERENVGVSLSVTPCWCYGTETMDTAPHTPKAVWGFNGTERPGAVYLAAMLAGYAQRGFPAYGIYGREVQDRTDTSIPDDVREKLLRFVKAGLAVAMMRGKSYLAVGTSSMGIAGSFIDPDLFQDYLGIRVENVDMCELDRRIAEGIYDKAEYAKALAWAKAFCKEGKDLNKKALQKSRAAKDADWEYVIKMTLILRDLMVGNPVLAEMGLGEEAVGRLAVLDNANHTRATGQRTAFFYHFESIPDRAVSRGLFDAAFDWARGRGLETVWGPQGFLAGDGKGLLVDGFEHRPAMGIAYNYPYYGELVEDAGFGKQVDLISCYVDRDISLPERYLQMAEKIRQRGGLRVVRFRSKAELRAVVDQVVAAYNQSFTEIQGFVPITQGEENAIAARILAVADPIKPTTPAARPMRKTRTRPNRSATPPKSTMNRPEKSAVMETARFICWALTRSVSELMESRISGATEPTVPAKSQKVRTARTSPRRSVSFPWYAVCPGRVAGAGAGAAPGSSDTWTPSSRGASAGTAPGT